MHNLRLVMMETLLVLQASEEAVALLKRFYALQEERVRTYTLFDE